jgi:hypothetical protein
MLHLFSCDFCASCKVKILAATVAVAAPGSQEIARICDAIFGTSVNALCKFVQFFWMFKNVD